MQTRTTDEIAYMIMSRWCEYARAQDLCPIACHECALLTEDAHLSIMEMLALIKRAEEKHTNDYDLTTARNRILNK